MPLKMTLRGCTLPIFGGAGVLKAPVMIDLSQFETETPGIQQDRDNGISFLQCRRRSGKNLCCTPAPQIRSGL